MSHTLDTFVTSLERDIENVKNKSPHEYDRSLKSLKRFHAAITEVGHLLGSYDENIKSDAASLTDAVADLNELVNSIAEKETDNG